MPAWLLPFISQTLMKLLLPFIFKELQKYGVISETQALAAKLGMKVKAEIDGVKTYHAPSDFPSADTKNNPFG